MSISELKKNTAEKDVVLYFSDLWRGFAKYWRLCILLAALSGGILFYISYIRFTPMYRVNTTFTVQTQSSLLSGDGEASAYSFSYDKKTADQLAAVFSYILKSSLLWEKVCEDLGVSSLPAAVSAECVAQTNLITLSAVGTNAQLTYDTLISVLEHYTCVADYIIGPTILLTISEPVLPSEAYNAQDWQKTTQKGILFGFALGLLWIFLYAIVRQTVRTAQDIHQELNQTCIGILPQVVPKRYRRKSSSCILLTNTLIGKEFPESVRLLKGAVQNRLKENEKVIVVTSTAPGEGKSVLTVNLAAMFAQSDAKILVIDADLRSSGIEKLLAGIEKESVFSGKNRTAPYRIEHFVPLKTDILTFVPELSLRRKIIRTGTMQQLLASLRAQYDLILIDTPPCGIISDAAIIAGAADAALYLIRQDTILAARIREGLNTLLSSDIHLIGCVLNGTAEGIGGYGHYYGCDSYKYYDRDR